MDDRLAATIDMGRQLGHAPLGAGSWPPSNTMSPKPRPTSVPSAILMYPAVTIDMGQKLGRAVPPFWEGAVGPHLTQSRLSQGLVPYQVAS